MSVSKSVSVVIPNYNGVKLLQQNLPNLIQELQKSIPDFEIIVADDASTDDSIAWVKQNFPEIKIVQNDKNGGFSKNMNSGIWASSKELILAINTDIYITSGFLLPLLSYFENTDTFSVGSRLEGFNGEWQDGGKWPAYGYDGIRSTIDFNSDKIKSNEWVKTWFCSAACCLYDANKLKKLGGYDEIYSPFYYEDADLCFRAWCMGWSCFYENKSVCKHPNSVTINKHNNSNFIKTVANRNKLILNFRFLDGFRKISYICLLILKLLTAWLGKPWFYISFWNYLSMKAEIRKANSKFNALKPKYNLLQISKIILKENNEKNIELF
jgi:GT2 family glycosyltransferase